MVKLNDTFYKMADIHQNEDVMVRFGIPFEKVMHYIEMLCNVAAVSLCPQETLNHLVLTFSMMYAKGKLERPELLQLINAGCNPLINISQITGKSITELADIMRYEEISFAMVEKALEHVTSKDGRFYGRTMKRYF